MFIFRDTHLLGAHAPRPPGRLNRARCALPVGPGFGLAASPVPRMRGTPTGRYRGFVVLIGFDPLTARTRVPGMPCSRPRAPKSRKQHVFFDCARCGLDGVRSL